MHPDFQPVVYIMASQRNGTLYSGVTSNLFQRIAQHCEGAFGGVTSKYAVKPLVWFEPHNTMEYAITREKQLKKWNRGWKLRLIEEPTPSGAISPRILGSHRYASWISAFAGRMRERG